jgi:hypothetical protein
MRRETQVAIRQPLHGIAGHPACRGMLIANVSLDVRSSSTGIASSSPPPTTSRLQDRRPHMVLEQRQMRFDVFHAPESWPLRPGQIERADPSEPAMARMSTAPSLESRVSPLASSAFCAPASSPSFNFCAAAARQRSIDESFASGPCSRVTHKRATSAAIETQAAQILSVKSTPGQMQTLRALASSAHGRLDRGDISA